jgi:RNA polymerase sigma factor (sigma-70 family)
MRQGKPRQQHQRAGPFSFGTANRSRAQGGKDKPVAARSAHVARTLRDETTAALLYGARDGDRASWDALVDRFAGVIWTVARSFGMPAADAAEVSQTTWLRLAEHLDRIRDPDRLAAWLVTTARRESIRFLRVADRHALLPEIADRAASEPATDTRVLASERDVVLRRCVEALPPRSRTLLAMLVAEPPIPYGEIAHALEMPVGSIGPTRARLLAMLRQRVEAAGIAPSD